MGLDGGAVDERLDLDRQPPAGADGEDRLGPQRSAAGVGGRRPVTGDEFDAHTEAAAALGEDERRTRRLDLDVARQRRAATDLRGRSEVGVDGDLDLDVGGLGADVADDDVVAQAVADVAVPLDDQGVAATADERDAVRVGGVGGKGFGDLAVERGG